MRGVLYFVAMRRTRIVSLLIAFSFFHNLHAQSGHEITIELPDTVRCPGARHFDYRYYRRVKACIRQLGLPSLERGSDTLQIRIWKLSSYLSDQEMILLRPVDDSVEVSGIDFLADVQTWSSPSDFAPLPRILVKKSYRPAKRDWLSYDWDTLNDTLWTAPSHCGAMAGEPTGMQSCYSYCVELADKNRYRFLFYGCPESPTNRNTIIEFTSDRYRSLRTGLAW